MAHVVDDGMQSTRRVRWENYSDGRVWELERGVDYDQDDEHARRAVMAWANRRGTRVRTSVPSPGRLQVEFQT